MSPPETVDKELPAGPPEFYAIVVGTGFAGAVTACRLVEAGFKICVLERGRRYGPKDFPNYPTEELFGDAGQGDSGFAPPPDFSRWLWSQDHGIYDVRDLGEAVTVQAAGYGGGSLIYASVHMRPPHEVFARGWPKEYTGEALSPYFDLAAYMLRAMPIPQRLAKTLQLQRAAQPPQPPSSWFRTPLAVNFEGGNDFGRTQNACDMRGQCWRGCDHMAKNTLDLNYLARAEDGGCDIRTMSNVTSIEHKGGMFIVHYDELVMRERPESESANPRDDGRSVTALHVFLCAGAVNTTELLLKCEGLLPDTTALGSHYFSNSDSLGVVFDCDEAHEPDYGPTITSALLYDHSSTDGFSHTLDFECGRAGPGRSPVAGFTVASSSGGRAVLAHDPIPDWGDWKHGAAGVLALTEVKGAFKVGDKLEFADTIRHPARRRPQAIGIARSPAIEHRDWFLVEDGGYPPDLEPLVGIFRSPLWLRRNRYLEESPRHPAAGGPPPTPRQASPLRRPPAGRLRVEAFADALGATSRMSFAPDGLASRALRPGISGTGFAATGAARELLLPGLLGQQLETIFPPWFLTSLAKERKGLLEQASAFALPALGQMLDELSATVAKQIDPDVRSRLSGTQMGGPQVEIDDRQVEILVRGLLRQVLQILAGSEVALATKAAQRLLNPVPGTPKQLVDTLANAVLWAASYDTIAGHTAVLLTMGRDAFRGKLTYVKSLPTPLQATLPTRLLDTASAAHERVLREVASAAWRGELRTNPGWTTLGKRVTVHSQGGCPMGEAGRSVTDAAGEVHGCKGLYVMDAAAFPTSVGVNPSATIAAIAEYKIEQFIRKSREPSELPWSAEEDHDRARGWMETHGRAALDPLNYGGVQSRNAPSHEINTIGMSFTEAMRGFWSPVPEGEAETDFGNLETFRAEAHLKKFVDAESDGIKNGRPIEVHLSVKADDLARVIATESTIERAKMRLTGCAALGLSEDGQTFEIDNGSFLQMFVRASPEAKSPKFFRYHFRFVFDGKPYVLYGLKVLCDAPGFDAWHDTSTLYFEVTGPWGRYRGILRVPLDTFLGQQLPSMEISGTSDAARKSWALAAFYKYFAGEVAEVYLARANALKDALFKLVTGIHV